MAKAPVKNNKKKLQKQESESSTADEESNVSAGCSSEESGSYSESAMEYSQDQLEEAEKNLEEVEIDELEDASSEATGSGSQDSNREIDDETLRTVFIKDIDYDLREADLTEQMERLGEVVRVTIPLTHDQARNKGFAYVEFKNISDAKKALRLDGTELLGRKVMVSQARPKSNQKIFTVFVKNLAYNTTKEELREHFDKFGKVYNISLPIDTENPERNKGFCFVEYNDEAIVAKVMKAKHIINERTLYLNEGNKNEDRNAKRSSDRLYGRRSDGNNGRRGGAGFRDNSREGGKFDRNSKRYSRKCSNNKIVFEDSD